MLKISIGLGILMCLLGCNANRHSPIEHDTNAKKNVLIVGVNPTSVKYIPSAMREVGYEPVFLVEAGKHYEGASKQSFDSCESHEADYMSEHSIAEVLNNHPKLLKESKALFSFYDCVFPTLERVGRRFSLQRPEAAVSRLSEKAEVCRLVPEFCPKSVVFMENSIDSQDFSMLSQTHGLILKPSLWGGAEGVVSIKATADLHKAVRTAIANSGLPDISSQTWILQERIPGRLASLEGYVQNGEVRMLGFSLRTRVELTEVVNEFPADEKLSLAARTQCKNALASLVARSGYKNGYFHCEFIMQENTAFLIDANIGRVAGAAFAEQFAISFGLDPKEIMRHVILLPLYPETVVSPFKVADDQRKNTLCINYCLAKAAVIKSIQFPANSKCLHTQFAANGHRVPPIGESDSSWVGVIAGIREDVLKEIDQITINTDDGQVSPAYSFQEQVGLAHAE